MENDSRPEPSGNAEEQGEVPRTAAKPSYDEIALRAYFIALERHSRGEPGDPLKDWIEAEQQLIPEAD